MNDYQQYSILLPNVKGFEGHLRAERPGMLYNGAGGQTMSNLDKIVGKRDTRCARAGAA